jgi:hypothetical protein
MRMDGTRINYYYYTATEINGRKKKVWLLNL